MTSPAPGGPRSRRTGGPGTSPGSDPRQARRSGPRAWARPGQVPADAGVAGQIASMRALVDGAVDGEEFVRAWFAGRSRALRHGERLRAPFARVLDDVFFLLEDEYTDDPALRGPDDLTDEAMVERVQAALDRLSALDGAPETS